MVEFSMARPSGVTFNSSSLKKDVPMVPVVPIVPDVQEVSIV
jgi:hypothetical protein